MRGLVAVVLGLFAVPCVLAGSSPARGAGGAASEPPRFVVGPRYALELPTLPEDGDIARGRRIVELLEDLATRLDAEFAKADVLPKSRRADAAAVRRFATTGPVALAKVEDAERVHRMSVRLERTRDAMAEAGRALGFVANTQGTAFYDNGQSAVLGVVASDDEPVSIPTLLDWGGLQCLNDRLGLRYSRPEQPVGACVPLGFAHFLRWSHLQDAAAMPARLGGIGEQYGDKVRALLTAEGGSTFPSLDELFAARPADFDSHPDRLYGAAVLLTEFVWEASEASRKAYLQALRDYAKTGSPVPEFAPAVLFASFKRLHRDPAAFEAAFHAFVSEKSAELNRQKAAAQ